MLSTPSQILHRSIPAILALLVFLDATPALSVEELIPESIKEEASRDREQEATEDPLALQQSQEIDKPSLQTILVVFKANASKRES